VFRSLGTSTEQKTIPIFSILSVTITSTSEECCLGNGKIVAESNGDINKELTQMQPSPKWKYISEIYSDGSTRYFRYLHMGSNKSPSEIIF
jgi:hypothetical protein